MDIESAETCLRGLGKATREEVEVMDEMVAPGRTPEHVVNDLITLKLESEKTFIYVGGLRFNQCAFLFASIDMENARDYDEIGSIDELSEVLDRRMEGDKVPDGITPEDIFWGHCSNLQAWAEHGYDTRLLHSNLAFPLLKRLAELGDKAASRSLNREIVNRLASGYEPTIKYLVEQRYVDKLNPVDLGWLLADVASAPNDEIVITNLFNMGIIDKLPPAEFMGFLAEWVREKDKYPGVSREEAALLAWLQFHVGETIPKVAEVKLGSFGFTEAGGHVTGLGLYKKGLKYLPESFGQFKWLRKLNLSKNKLKSLPGTIGQLTSLQELNLSYNQLMPLPKTFGQLTSLTALDLFGNKVNSLPETFGQLTSLKELNIDDNRLTSLPETIGQLLSLETLSLFKNQLTALPGTMGRLTSLKTLHLGNNQLSSLPETFRSLVFLQHLDLRANKLLPFPRGIKKWIKDLKKKGCHVRK